MPEDWMTVRQWAVMRGLDLTDEQFAALEQHVEELMVDTLYKMTSDE